MSITFLADQEQTFSEEQKSQIKENIGIVGSSSSSTNMGVDYIVEQQHSGNNGVCYRKWASGLVEMWVGKTMPFSEEGCYEIVLPVWLSSEGADHVARPMVHCSAGTIDSTSYLPIMFQVHEDYNMEGDYFFSKLVVYHTQTETPPPGGTFIDITAYIVGFWK